MKRGSLRVLLVASHVGIALLAGIVTFVIVRVSVPFLFDNEYRRRELRVPRRDGWGAAGREIVGTAVNDGLLVGTLVGIAVAAVVALILSERIVAPLALMAAATRKIARGEYSVSVPPPNTAELATLAGDIATLGRTINDTESRRVRLLGEVAHEMRTPLTVIDGYVEAMQDGVVTPSPANLAQITDEIRRLERLCGDLSTLSRAQEGQLALAPATVALDDVVAGVCTRLRPQADERGLTLTTELGAGGTVWADEDRLGQVFTNLLGNALKATERGGIVVRSRREAGRVVVDVTDTGEGLASEDLEKVFERFYRVRHDARPDGPGSGIGLTIARQIARAHGGDIVASSAGPGTGATFTVWLPASQ